MYVSFTGLRGYKLFLTALLGLVVAASIELFVDLLGNCSDREQRNKESFCIRNDSCKGGKWNSPGEDVKSKSKTRWH